MVDLEDPKNLRPIEYHLLDGFRAAMASFRELAERFNRAPADTSGNVSDEVY
jgi:hypothetical protein